MKLIEIKNERGKVIDYERVYSYNDLLTLIIVLKNAVRCIENKKPWDDIKGKEGTCMILRNEIKKAIDGIETLAGDANREFTL